VFGFGVILTIFYHHLRLFPSGDKLYEKPTDLMGPMYSLVGVASNVVGAVGFGKPYCAACISMFGMLGNPIFIYFSGLFGLYEWIDKLIPLVAAMAMFIEFFYKRR
jgi:hypothetical protein